jgi:hypothetical protein
LSIAALLLLLSSSVSLRQVGDFGLSLKMNTTDLLVEHCCIAAAVVLIRFATSGWRLWAEPEDGHD